MAITGHVSVVLLNCVRPKFNLIVGRLTTAPLVSKAYGMYGSAAKSATSVPMRCVLNALANCQMP
jgi:hypothetical protein